MPTRARPSSLIAIATIDEINAIALIAMHPLPAVYAALFYEICITYTYHIYIYIIDIDIVYIIYEVQQIKKYIIIN